MREIYSKSPNTNHPQVGPNNFQPVLCALLSPVPHACVVIWEGECKQEGHRIHTVMCCKGWDHHTIHFLQTPTHSASPHSSREVERREEGGERGREEGGGDESDVEREASDLYQWTQSLSFDDVQ